MIDGEVKEQHQETGTMELDRLEADSSTPTPACGDGEGSNTVLGVSYITVVDITARSPSSTISSPPAENKAEV